MKQWTKLTQIKGRMIHSYFNRVILHNNGDEVHVDVSLEGRGSYDLDIFGKILIPEWQKEDDDIPVNRLFQYRVVCAAPEPVPQFASNEINPEWGMSSHCQAAGFQLLTPNSAVIQANEGTSQIRMQLPIQGVVPLFHRRYYRESETQRQQLQSSHVMGEKEDDIATYHIRCPNSGEYRFEIHYKPAPADGNGGYYTGAAFLIQCDVPAQDSSCYINYNELWGPSLSFYTEYGLRTTYNSFTIRAPGRKVSLVIRKTKPVDMFATLDFKNGPIQFVDTTPTTESTTFHVELPEEKD